MKIAICDDDIKERARMQQYISSVEPFEERWKLFEYSDGSELVHAHIHENMRFELIYLDIQMEKMNGLETAKKIRQIDEKVIIIFVTSFIDYQIKVMRYGAFNYICKPYKQNAIIQSLKEVQERIAANRERAILVRTRESDILIPYYKILYMQLEKGKILTYHLITGEKISEYRKIAEIATHLEGLHFIQIARDTIVNAEHINKLNHTAKSILIANNEVLLANKRRWPDIQAAFLNYLNAD